jgi:hypothetical protein
LKLRSRHWSASLRVAAGHARGQNVSLWPRPLPSRQSRPVD